MIPKEKAKELYNKMWAVEDSMSRNDAKQCVLIAIDEIKKVCPFFDAKIRETEDQLSAFDFQFVSYWQEVETETKKL